MPYLQALVRYTIPRGHSYSPIVTYRALFYAHSNASGPQAALGLLGRQGGIDAKRKGRRKGFFKKLYNFIRTNVQPQPSRFGHKKLFVQQGGDTAQGRPPHIFNLRSPRLASADLCSPRLAIRPSAGAQPVRGRTTVSSTTAPNITTSNSPHTCRVHPNKKESDGQERMAKPPTAPTATSVPQQGRTTRRPETTRSLSCAEAQQPPPIGVPLGSTPAPTGCPASPSISISQHPSPPAGHSRLPTAFVPILHRL